MAPDKAGQAVRFRLILVALALSGCVLAGAHGIVDTAEFHADGLYEALGRSGATAEPAHPGFAVTTSLVPEAWNGATVGFVDWRPDATRVARLAPDRIEVLAPEDDSMRAILRTFLPNTTAIDPAGAAAVERALLANRTSMVGYGQSGEPVAAPPGDPATGGFFYAADLPIGADVARAFETVGGVEGAQHRTGLGFVGLGREGWEVALQLPRRTYEIDGVTLRADPRDTASASIERASADATAAQSLERLDRALADLGLPASGLSPGSFQHVV